MHNPMINCSFPSAIFFLFFFFLHQQRDYVIIILEDATIERVIWYITGIRYTVILNLSRTTDIRIMLLLPLCVPTLRSTYALHIASHFENGIVVAFSIHDDRK